jgi:hypothetical protein
MFKIQSRSPYGAQALQITSGRQNHGILQSLDEKTNAATEGSQKMPLFECFLFDGTNRPS